MGPTFCEQCGVTNDLHDGPNTCDIAEAKASRLEAFYSLPFKVK